MNDGDLHRRQGIDAFNSVWELLDGREYTPSEVDELLSRAYASFYHWQRATGREPKNDARGSWLLLALPRRARPGRPGAPSRRSMCRGGRRSRDSSTSISAMPTRPRARALGLPRATRRGGRRASRSPRSSRWPRTMIASCSSRICSPSPGSASSSGEPADDRVRPVEDRVEPAGDRQDCRSWLTTNS